MIANNATSPGDREIGPGRSLTSRLFDQASGDEFGKDGRGKIDLAEPSPSQGVSLRAERFAFAASRMRCEGLYPHQAIRRSISSGMRPVAAFLPLSSSKAMTSRGSLSEASGDAWDAYQACLKHILDENRRSTGDARARCVILGFKERIPPVGPSQRGPGRR